MQYRWLIFSLIIGSFHLTLHCQMDNVQSTLEIYHLDNQQRQIVIQENDHFEAPNWSPDGSYLLINGHGKLQRVDLNTKKKSEINTGFADKLNNDHGLSPDGKQIVISHHDQTVVTNDQPRWYNSRIYILPIEGGTPKAITPNVPSFWHGWSPDGSTLIYTGIRNQEFDIYAISVDGGEEVRLTTAPGLDDGSEYSHDGKYIYYNSMQSGKMELWRMDSDGQNKIQLTNDQYSNWFPHPCPNGKYIVYLSYLEDQGSSHPPMKKVALRLLELETEKIMTLFEFTGGQGTINVPSWSPDGEQFAFVSYEYIE